MSCVRFGSLYGIYIRKSLEYLDFPWPTTTPLLKFPVTINERMNGLRFQRTQMKKKVSHNAKLYEINIRTVLDRIVIYTRLFFE